MSIYFDNFVLYIFPGKKEIFANVGWNEMQNKIFKISC